MRELSANLVNNRRLAAALLGLLGWLAVCAGSSLGRAADYTLAPLVTGLDKPVSLLAIDDGRLLVTQLGGLVVVLQDERVRAEPFLNLVARATALEGEQGFFSVALEPAAAAARYGRSPLLIAAFTERESGDLVIAAYPTIERLTRADETAERVLLRIALPQTFHHGGQVAFGPDGLLYVSIGNGELANEYLHQRPWSSQSLAELRGKLLRIDVSTPSPDGSYLVPADNPFVNTPGARPEIYALGLRNPWKFSFDPTAGSLYLVDVGSDRWEEINRIRPGGNYGWPAREGPECQAFPDAPGQVDPTCTAAAADEPAGAGSYDEPLAYYAHLGLDPAGGQAITGGLVSYDPALPELVGHYLFADFVVGRIWSLDLQSGQLELLLDTDLAITQLAVGPNGEVLVLAISGELLRLRDVSR